MIKALIIIDIQNLLNNRHVETKNLSVINNAETKLYGISKR
jgi:hypothetical protein